MSKPNVKDHEVPPCRTICMQNSIEFFLDKIQDSGGHNINLYTYVTANAATG